MALSDTALVTLIQAKNFLRVDPAANLRVLAEPVGVGDDVVVEFDLDNTPVEGSLSLFVDGVLQVEATDFTISGATITFASAPATNEVITASYLKAASVDTFESYDDALLEMLIEATTRKAEDYTGRVFVQRTIEEIHLGDNQQILRLYKRPVESITSVTVTGTDYIAGTDFDSRLAIGRLYCVGVWPLTSEIVVTYIAGYGEDRAATQALIPEAVSAILMMIANLHDNRVDQLKSEQIGALGTLTFDIPSQARALLDPLRVSVL